MAYKQQFKGKHNNNNNVYPYSTQRKRGQEQVEYSTLHKQEGRHAEEVTHVQTSSFDFRKQQSSSDRASKETKGTTTENFKYLSQNVVSKIHITSMQVRLDFWYHQVFYLFQ